MSRAEWDALPWYDQRTYIDGFVDEGLLEMGNEEPTMHDDSTPNTTGSSAEEGLPTPKHNPDQPKKTPSIPGMDPTTASMQQLKALGLSVIDGEKA